MNHLEIKKNREALGMTQEELAKKLGVSLKTVSNYESGKVIPISKKELLLDILSNNTISEPIEKYEFTGYEKQIAQAETEIKLHQEIIRLLKIQIELIKKAKENHKD